MTQRTSRTALRALAAAMVFAAGIPAVHAQTVANPPATGVTITSSVASPQLVGTPVTFTASGTGSAGYQYRFFITTAGSGVFTMVQDYGVASTWTMPATIEDPKVFSRPWKIRMPLYRHVEKNARLMEFKCVEFAEELMYGQFSKKTSK